MDFIIQLLTVGLVLGVILGLLWVLRRQQSGLTLHRDTTLSSRSRLQLTPQHSIHLIQFRDRELLIAVHPGGYSIIQDSK